MKKQLYHNGHIHTMVSEEEEYSVMGVADGRICYLGNRPPEDVRSYRESINLEGRHIYPTLTDSHLHLLYTIVLSAASFTLCAITPEGIRPDNFGDMEKTVRGYCARHPEEKIITANGFIPSAVREKRLPNRFELDEWTGGRAMIVYSIDGHSSAMSTPLMDMLKLETDGSDGVFSGEAHEFMQGRVTGLIASSVTPAVLARGIANFSNLCASYGISRVCAMDGNEDVSNDILTRLLALLARHMDIDVRLYPQYMDFRRLKPFAGKQKSPRAGGCGVWELDGSVGSHSAAFHQPYKDTGVQGHCYYPDEKIREKVAEALDRGLRLSCHAIGEAAIDQITDIYADLAGRIPQEGAMMRIDHFEFPSRSAVEKVKKLRLALTVQPGFSWIDKRYIKSYEQYLPQSVIMAQLPLRELAEAGVRLCGSSDSPVQSVNPYDQMLGMTDFYVEEQSLTPFEAMKTYTVNPARMLGEDGFTGTLELGKDADFFASDTDIFRCEGTEIASVRAEFMVIRGKRYKEKKGTVSELAAALLRRGRSI